MIRTKDTNELIQRADRQLRQLADQIKQVEATREQAETRIHSLQEQARVRTLAAAEQEQHLQDLKAKCDQAQHYATLAGDTSQEQEAIAHLRDLQKTLKKAQSDVDQAHDWHRREQAKEESILAALAETITKRQAELATLKEQHSLICAAREQAHQEHGEHLRSVAITAIKQQQARIDAARLEVVSAQLELSELVESQILALSDYPKMQRELQAMQHNSDATSRTISAAIAYIDVLLTERRELATTLYLPAARYQSPWWAMLAIPDDELWRHQNIRSQASLLANRREKLQQLLAEYREQRER